MLSERTWTLCSGFYVVGHENYLFLNDSTCEDGAGEFSAIRGGVGAEQHVQIESITFSWCTFDQSLTIHPGRPLRSHGRQRFRPACHTPFGNA